MPAAKSSTATLRRLPAPLALMALIFFLSAQSDLGTDLGLVDLIGRKFVHAGTYGLLTLLWWWTLLPLGVGADPSERGVEGELMHPHDALIHPRPRRSRPRRWPLIAAAGLSFLYAVSDEYHQTFTAGRSGSPIDVAIDTAGIAIAGWMIATGRLQRLIAVVISRARRP